MTFCVCVIILFSCKQKNESVHIEDANITKTDTVVHIEIKLPYSSVNTYGYYSCDADGVNCELNDSLTDKLVDFTDANVSLPLKENNLDGRTIEGYKFYEIGRFDFKDDVLGQLVIYNTYGDNDIRIMSIQLNSFKKGKLVDQLVLDCRFIFENKYYRDFVIQEDGTINIDKFKIETLLVNEDGDIIGELDPPLVTKETVNYKINKQGHFIETERK